MPIAFDLDLNLAPDEVSLSPNSPKKASLGNVTLEDQEVPLTENGDLSELEVNTRVPILQQPMRETQLVSYSRRKRGEVPPTENGDLSEFEVNTPVPILQQSMRETQLVSYSRRRRGEIDELEEILPVEQNPEWLPENWRVKRRTRSDGKSKDKYFIEPERHRQFRSRREVLEYVDSGHRRFNKKLKTGETSKARVSWPSRTAQPKRGGSPPRPITWISKNGGNNYWAPYIWRERVAGERWMEWQAMFKDDPSMAYNLSPTPLHQWRTKTRSIVLLE